MFRLESLLSASAATLLKTTSVNRYFCREDYDVVRVRALSEYLV